MHNGGVLFLGQMFREPRDQAFHGIYLVRFACTVLLRPGSHLSRDVIAWRKIATQQTQVLLCFFLTELKIFDQHSVSGPMLTSRPKANVLSTSGIQQIQTHQTYFFSHLRLEVSHFESTSDYVLLLQGQSKIKYSTLIVLLICTWSINSTLDDETSGELYFMPRREAQQETKFEKDQFHPRSAFNNCAKYIVQE